MRAGARLPPGRPAVRRRRIAAPAAVVALACAAGTGIAAETEAGESVPVSPGANAPSPPGANAPSPSGANTPVPARANTPALSNSSPQVRPGDVQRGAALAVSRTTGLCVLCHPVPGVAPVHQGNLAPDLAGAGGRWSSEALRERLLRPERFNPDTLMPAYGRTEALVRVAPARRGQPLLDAQQIEDVVAWLGSLR